MAPADLRLFEPPPVLSEREWQSVLQRALDREGWRWQHVFAMRTHSGQWRSSTTASGWPDLVCYRPPWTLAIEVKAQKGIIGPAQVPWLETFAEIPNGLAWVLRPADDWQVIARWIARPWIAPRVHGFQPTRPLASWPNVPDTDEESHGHRFSERRTHPSLGTRG